MIKLDRFIAAMNQQDEGEAMRLWDEGVGDEITALRDAVKEDGAYARFDGKGRVEGFYFCVAGKRYSEKQLLQIITRSEGFS
ncbi:MAG TPA: hypothetical protein ENH62_04545 [Marinobacter sp.]|uniref:Uncharacterized protein n=1 Tax=marine sediment metagenome TaxID=412755 RepID=A0A0F9RKR6_9ZZZZ|nr:hypothetical protein [Marinobacter sp.]